MREEETYSFISFFSLVPLPVLREAKPGLLNIFTPKDYCDMLWLILKE